MGQIKQHWTTGTQRLWRTYRRWLRYGLLMVVTGMLCGLLSPPLMATPVAPTIAQTTLEQGQQFYEAGRLQEAADALQQTAEQSSDPVVQVSALRNLALVYRQLGQWTAANQAIDTAKTLLKTVDLSQQAALLASVLDVQGSLQLDQGQAVAAIQTWEQSAALYRQLTQPEKASQALINQAQAMQQLGYHRRVLTTLQPVVTALADQPASLTQAVALRTLGDSLVQVGSLAEAQATLELSLNIAQTLPNAAALSAAALSLGNLRQLQGDTAAALSDYDQAEAASAPPLTRLQAQINRLRLYSRSDRIASAQSLWPQIRADLAALPVSQATISARINLGETLIGLPGEGNPTPQQTAEILVVAVRQAQALGDARLESYAQGTLGHLYETLTQWQDAKTLTETALRLAQTVDAKDILYRWQWQLGRIDQAMGQRDQAISAYANAVDSLQSLRTDLVAVNPAVQVSFQENVEPIHRSLVSLLLAPDRPDVSEADLEKARKTIESLQLAELDNFFREACLNAAAVSIDQLDPRAAVIYPILLPDRLETIVSLPDQPLRHYASPVPAADVEPVISQLQQSLVIRVGQQYMAPAQQLYDWMIRPLAPDLADSGANTLVFVLDGSLRNIPMAVLNDGSQFLIEQYSVALTPGLQLIDPKPIQAQALKVLTAGLSESRQGFSALPNVEVEVEEIQATVPSSVLLNDDFTLAALRDNLTFEAAPIVHLATHGKFSSSQDETFVLTWDDRLDINTLNDLIQASELNQAGPIELLVLSACQTAAGDKQAALGLAGMAVRSGARSTIATLWQVNDEATALLMSQLYSDLASQTLTKAEALRQAQLKVLNEPQFRRHPFFWAPYVLVGNWL